MGFYRQMFKYPTSDQELAKQIATHESNPAKKAIASLAAESYSYDKAQYTQKIVRFG